MKTAVAIAQALPADQPKKTELETYLDGVLSLGFKKVLELPFVGRFGKKEYDEKLLVFFHPRDALLLSFDTYIGTRVHSGNLHYNWRRRCSIKEAYERRLFSSGHWASEDVYIGHHNIPGTDLRRTIRAFRASGKFVRPWIERPFIGLVHNGDFLEGQRLGGPSGAERYNEFRKLSDERVLMLPPDVRGMLGPQ